MVRASIVILAFAVLVAFMSNPAEGQLSDWGRGGSGSASVDGTDIAPANVTATGTVQGATVTDGTATLTGGALSDVTSFLVTPGSTPTATEGTVYYDATNNTFYGRDDSSWVDLGGAGGGGTDYAAPLDDIETITASTDTLDTANGVVLLDTGSNNVTVTLPAASGNSGLVYVIKAIDATTNTATVDGNASEEIDGETTYVFSADYESITIICDGTGWHII